ncbi:DegQ family serine endoprotease [Pseudogemmobacter sp. W21_MBD1_M6]|uniref:DegQ family serine endoprotease n=1 Tax=Pseudogemmobacter sp. W21_MBD1_M6 TaxID=3240271 RepID=UPI003F9B9AF8
MIRHFHSAIAILFLVIAPLTGNAQSYAQMDERGVPTIAPLLRQVTDAVVNISVVSEQPPQMNPLFNDPFFQKFFGLPETIEPRRRLSAGSGVIVDPARGYILTNNHVIENAVDITVTLKDRRNFAATVIGTDPATDVALLQITADALFGLPMGDSSRLQVGDFVVAVGNPFGLGQTVTSGIISALDRSGINPQGYEDFIQTDASINPGNSGGALVTFDGKLVGINSAIIAPSGGNVGIGFAVPINMARSIMDQLIQFGEIRRGQLGIMIQDLTPDLADALGLGVSRGAIVTQVLPGTPADAAGLQAGDIITAVNGNPVESSSNLRNQIGLVMAGTTLRLSLMRNGTEMEVAATIQAGQEQDEAAAPAPDLQALSGAQFGPLTPGMDGFGDVKGVAVIAVTPGSPAAFSGLMTGDVITAVNNVPVTDTAAFYAELPDQKGPVALTIYRNGSTLYLIVR